MSSPENRGNLTTLKMNVDFRRAYKRGRSYTDPALVVYVLKNRAGFCRYGITASKKTGNAVERNRSRRIVREAYRHLSARVRPGYDIVLVVRSATKHMKSTDIEPVMLRLFRTAGICVDGNEEQTDG